MERLQSLALLTRDIVVCHDDEVDVAMGIGVADGKRPTRYAPQKLSRRIVCAPANRLAYRRLNDGPCACRQVALGSAVFQDP